MKNESDELTETGFRKQIITNFSEVKEHVLTQCKGTKNIERRFDEMQMRINSLENNISDLMGLKNVTRKTKHKNFAKHIQVSIAELNKQKKSIRD